MKYLLSISLLLTWLHQMSLGMTNVELEALKMAVLHHNPPYKANMSEAITLDCNSACGILKWYVNGQEIDKNNSPAVEGMYSGIHINTVCSVNNCHNCGCHTCDKLKNQSTTLSITVNRSLEIQCVIEFPFNNAYYHVVRKMFPIIIPSISPPSPSSSPSPMRTTATTSAHTAAGSTASSIYPATATTEATPSQCACSNQTPHTNAAISAISVGSATGAVIFVCIVLVPLLSIVLVFMWKKLSGKNSTKDVEQANKEQPSRNSYTYLSRNPLDRSLSQSSEHQELESS